MVVVVVVVVVEVDSWPSIWGGVDGGEFRFGEAAIAGPGSIASVFTFRALGNVLLHASPLFVFFKNLCG